MKTALLSATLGLSLLSPRLIGVELNEELDVTSGSLKYSINYRAESNTEIQWQFSTDGGEIWRPVTPRIGRILMEAPPAGWNGRTAVDLAGGFPAGISLRARFVEGDQQPILSETVTVPHRRPFPNGQRIATLTETNRGQGIRHLRAAGNLVVASVPEEFYADARNFVLKSWWESEDGQWLRGPDLPIPADLPDRLRFGFFFAVADEQLIVCGSDDGMHSTALNGLLYIYDWSGPTQGWQLSQTLEKPAELPSTDTFAKGVFYADGRLLVKADSGAPRGGSMCVYTRDETSGNWIFDGLLRPQAVGSESWVDASNDPIVAGNLIITHAHHSSSDLNTFLFEDTPEGWTYRGGTKETSLIRFSLGSNWAEVEGDFEEIENGFGEGTSRLAVYEPGATAGEKSLLCEGFFNFGYFPQMGTEEWVIFAFEPSAKSFLPEGGVALTPLYEGTLYPEPLLLVPDGIEAYDFVGRDYSLTGNRLFVASVLKNEQFVIDLLDLTDVPHPSYPEVAFPVWVETSIDSTDLTRMQILYRASNDTDVLTRIEYLDAEGNWNPTDVQIEDILLDPDPDGDGGVSLRQARIPLDGETEPTVYRVSERPRLIP
jgi:hypothetical protein